MSMPPLPRWLGLAGLVPQVAAVAIVLSRNPDLRLAALALGHAYAALILSFLGGLWWGLAARAERPPGWVWVAAVVPSLIALATAIPLVAGWSWPGPSLGVVAAALIVALPIDLALLRRRLAPAWWMSLRLPLSAGLGLLTAMLMVG